MFHLSDGGRIIGEFSERVGRSGTGAVGTTVVGTDRGTPSPLTESAVGAVVIVAAAAAATVTAAAAAAAAGPIFLSTLVLATRRIMITQSRLLLA